MDMSDVECRSTGYVEEAVRDELVGLMDAYQHMLFNFLTVPLGDRDAAQDCAQDAFLRAYEHLHRVRQVNVAWLYRVARNRAIDVLRRRKRVRTDLETIEAVEVVRFAPVERGIKCVPKGPTASDCNTPLDFGTATVWIDDATHVVLKYEEISPILIP